MLTKLPVIIAIELLIGIVSFTVAGDKTQFGELTFIFIFLSALIAFSYLAYKRLKRSDLV